MRPYSLYLSIVEGYATTVITLESLFRQPMDFQKCFIIAAGTTDPRLLALLEQIRTQGYLSYPPERFLVILHPLEKSIGMAEAWNLAMTLTQGEDLFYTSNNCWFGPSTVQRFLETINQSSEIIWTFSPTNIISSSIHLQNNYDARIHSRFIHQDKTPQQYREAIEEFFSVHGPYPGHTVDETLEHLMMEQNPGYTLESIGDCGWYFKQDCFTKVGFFDERFSRDLKNRPCGGGEEYDYMDRIHQAGGHYAMVNNAMALHIIYGQTSKTGYRGEQEAELRGRYIKKVKTKDTDVWYRGKALPSLHNIRQVVEKDLTNTKDCDIVKM